jgi:hypothetical protein
MGASRLYDFSKILSVPISYFFEDFEDMDNSGDTVVTMNVAMNAAPSEHNKMASRETLEMVRALLILAYEGIFTDGLADFC